MSAPLTTKVATGSPYQLDPSQTRRASKALVHKIKTDQDQKEPQLKKKSLLVDDEESDGKHGPDDVPIWLIVTTKHHIVDRKRLKPSKIVLPHSINTSLSRICLITADPQRMYKDLINEPSFPPDLSCRISRVIGFSKLKANYKSYESRRQLLSEHEIFLADDRIITFLPSTLGKLFYKNGSKRPIPVCLTGNLRPPKAAGIKKPKNTGDETKGSKLVGAPADVAKELSKTLHSTLVQLSPSVTTAIKIGKASWAPDLIAQNIEATVGALTERHVPKGWRNIRAIHVKGPNTMALPIWLAEELWMDEEDVLDEKWKPKEKILPS